MIRRSTAVLLLLLVLLGCSNGHPEPVPPPVSGETRRPEEPPAPPAVYDLVIRGGTVLDGSGTSGFRADLAVLGDRIVKVGNLGRYTAGREIDATGLMVAPGFINPHSHTHDEEINPFKDYDTIASLKQGITTEIGGVDGRSPLNIGKELERIAAQGTGVNFGLFVGQGSLRRQTVGWARTPASSEQLEQMKQLVRQAMQDGAFGLSTGLEYFPGGYAAQAEVTALVREIQPFGGVYSTHIRSEGAGILPALREALAIGKDAGVTLNISHFKIVGYQNWHLEDQVIGLVEQAIAGGQKVVADVYPYLAPDYAVNRPLAEWRSALPAEYLVVTRSKEATTVGKTVADLARQWGVSADEAADRLLAADPGVAVVALVSSRPAMLRFYQAPWSVVSTDGESQPRLSSPAEALGLSLHRRSFGSYPALLGQYVREEKILPLESMIRKMSGAVADYLGVKDRGYLKPGYFADIVLFDPGTVADRTSWIEPQEYPSGIRYVLVNGRVAVDEGKWTGGRHGRVLRRGE